VTEAENIQKITKCFGFKIYFFHGYESADDTSVTGSLLYEPGLEEVLKPQTLSSINS